MESRIQDMSQDQNVNSSKDEEIARLKGDMDKLRGDAQAKIAQLQERIKELNQKLIAYGGGSGGQERSKR
jgi:uncharacterized protein YlxW (UPF0749 family)